MAKLELACETLCIAGVLLTPVWLAYKVMLFAIG